jgi:methylphosphotriester-DNA--protein-cysteine methyltransferase
LPKLNSPRAALDFPWTKVNGWERESAPPPFDCKKMPESVTAAFSEPEDFETALRMEGLRSLVITARGRFRARLTRVSLNGMSLSAVEEKLPRIGFIAVPANTLLVSFATGPGPAPICNGVGLRPGELFTVFPGEQFHARISGPTQWGAMRLPVDHLLKYGAALTGKIFPIATGLRRWKPPASVGRDLRGFHAAAMRIARTRPRDLVDSEAAHGLEQQLFHAIAECLSEGSADEDARTTQQDHAMMVCFEALLGTAQGTRRSMSSICEALHVSERRLRQLCAAHLGMSPIAYERLQRMWRTRRALRTAGIAESVSAIARANGFQDLGRFAINYRGTFGESPSTTLRRRHEMAATGG